MFFCDKELFGVVYELCYKGDDVCKGIIKGRKMDDASKIDAFCDERELSVRILNDQFQDILDTFFSLLERRVKTGHKRASGLLVSLSR